MPLPYSSAISTATDFEIDQSLRFNDDDSAYLSKTMSSAGSSRTTWTMSFWLKRGTLGTTQEVFRMHDDGNNHDPMWFEAADDTFHWEMFKGGGWFAGLVTNKVFKDTSAWYHIVLAFDTTQGTAADRLKMYINGVQETSFGTTYYPAQNSESLTNKAGLHHWGANNLGANEFDGYLAELHFIDGTALTPTSFGETGDYGEWKPIKVSGLTYGTNGYYLDFANSSALGDDAAGSNDWTVNNLTASDQMVDSPTNNFATLNPLYRGMPKAGRTDTPNVIGQGNLYIKPNHEKHTSITITPTTGKWYLEVYVNGHSPYGPIVGWLNNEATTHTVSGSFYGNTGSWRAYSSSANNTIYLQNQGATSVTTTGYFAAGEILQLAWDCSSGKMWVGRDGDWFDSSMGTTGNPATGANAMFTATAAQAAQNLSPYFASGDEYGGDTEGSRFTLNCGQDSSFAGAKTAQGNQDGNDIGDFYYTPPTGFLALCTKNLPDVAVIPSEHFNTVLYTGNGGTQSITGFTFQPDWIWDKSTNQANSHMLVDAVRGVGKYLRTNLTNAEVADASVLTSFDSDGVTVGDINGNATSSSSVMFGWKANGSGSANTTGSINTISTSANVDSGFSIVKWVGNEGSDESIGHGLSKAPEMILTWNLDEGWGNATYHKDMGTDKYLMMSETTGHENMSDTDIWANTAPTSSVFYAGTDIMTNWDDRNYIAYCFHSVDGYSKFGSYKGNNNADGTFVYLGFRPMWILVKRIYPNGFNWMLFRHDDKQLEANSTSVEFGGDYIDMLSNGFKARTQANTVNDSADYIYMAFAETPFKYSNAR